MKAKKISKFDKLHGCRKSRVGKNAHLSPLVDGCLGPIIIGLHEHVFKGLLSMPQIDLHVEIR